MQSVFYIDISPVIARFGSFNLEWYGVLIGLAIVTAVVWLLVENRKTRGLSYATLISAVLIGIVSGAIFAKLFHVIDNFELYRRYPSLILSFDGWAVWGMALGVIFGMWIYSRFGGRFRFTVLADMLAPGLILAQAIGRVGCTINGCCYGLETTSSLAVIYTHPDSYAPIGIPVLPVTVFEIFFNLIVFGVLLSLRKKLKPEGSLFLIYCALYAAWRFGSDFMRAGNPFLAGMHEAQIIALIVLLITFPLIILKVRWAGRDAVNAAKSISSFRGGRSLT
jgi:phosphatidylglycerol:prolipoprotein diacylglycerol transferase